MSHLTVAIAATKTMTLVFGALITYLAYTAYLRTRASELRALSIGFSIVTVGAVLGGVVDLVGDVLGFTGETGVLYGVLIQSTLTMLGFAVVTYSLYRE